MNKQRIGKFRGFTLIELMIVVVIIGVLAALAYPAYQNYVRESRRSDGQIAVLELAGQMEDFFSKNLRYATSLGAGGWSSTSPGLHYTISLSNPGGTGTFRLTATPASTLQLQDVCDGSTPNCCSSLGTDQTGAKRFTPATGSKCWGEQK